MLYILKTSLPILNKNHSVRCIYSTNSFMKGQFSINENRPDVLFHQRVDRFFLRFTHRFLFRVFLRRLRCILFQRASLCMLNGLIQMRGRNSCECTCSEEGQRSAQQNNS